MSTATGPSPPPSRPVASGRCPTPGALAEAHGVGSPEIADGTWSEAEG